MVFPISTVSSLRFASCSRTLVDQLYLIRARELKTICCAVLCGPIARNRSDYCVSAELGSVFCVSVCARVVTVSDMSVSDRRFGAERAHMDMDIFLPTGVGW